MSGHYHHECRYRQLYSKALCRSKPKEEKLKVPLANYVQIVTDAVVSAQRSLEQKHYENIKNHFELEGQEDGNQAETLIYKPLTFTFLNALGEVKAVPLYNITQPRKLSMNTTKIELKTYVDGEGNVNTCKPSNLTLDFEINEKDTVLQQD